MILKSAKLKVDKKTTRAMNRLYRKLANQIYQPDAILSKVRK